MDEETEIFRSNLHIKDDTPKKQQSWTIAHLSQLLPMLWPPSQVAPQLATDSHNVSNLQEGAKIIAPISQKSKLSHPEDNLDRLSRSTSIQLWNVSQERHLHQSSPHSSDFLLHVQLRGFFCVNALDHLLSKRWDADCKHFSLGAFQLPQQEEEKKKKERKRNKKKALEGREDDEDEGKGVKGEEERRSKGGGGSGREGVLLTRTTVVYQFPILRIQNCQRRCVHQHCLFTQEGFHSAVSILQALAWDRSSMRLSQHSPVKGKATLT